MLTAPPSMFSRNLYWKFVLITICGLVSAVLQCSAQSIFADQIAAPCAGIAGSDASAKIQCAINALPAAGGVVDARLLSDVGGTGTTNIDPGAKAVTILLGPYTYHVTQITLEHSFKIIGMGGGGQTLLQSMSTTLPVFIVPQAAFATAFDVLLEGFQILGGAGNTTQDGMFLDTSTAGTGAGLQYSRIQDIVFQHFGGSTVHIKGPNANYNALTQFDTFINVRAFRDSGNTGTTLKIEGGAGGLKFINSEFDGPSSGGSTTGTNIYLGVASGSNTAYPFTVEFDGLTSQSADVAVVLDGCLHCEFLSSHYELLHGGYRLLSDAPDIGLLIDHSYFATNVGANGGNGYLLNGTGAPAATTVNVTNSIWGQFGGPQPDNITLGSYTLTSCNNTGPPNYTSLGGMYEFCTISGQSINAVNVQAGAGNNQTAGNITLGAGWGTGATVTGLLGKSQTERFTITSGSASFSAAPAVTVTFPNVFPLTPLCTLDVTGITGAGGAIIFNIGTLSTATAQFTATTSTGAAFTPAAAETYNVVMRCGP